MSLINDALKRARDASFEAGNPRPAAPEAAQPVAVAPKRKTRRSMWVWVWLSLAIVMLVLAGMLLLALRQFRPIERSNEVRVQPKVVVPEPAHVAPIEPAPVVEKKVETVAAAVTPPPAPEPPRLVLQGISSGPDGREAMINGNNVRVGDELDGAKVVMIETRRVKLQFGEHEILLRMP